MKKYLQKVMATSLSMIMFASPFAALANEEIVEEEVIIEEQTEVEDVIEVEDVVEMPTSDYPNNPDGKWVKVNGQWRWQYPDGTYATNCHMEINGVLYGFNQYGNMLSNKWEAVGASWQYWDENGKQATGWKQINNKWYYFDPNNGNMASVNGWEYINGSYYYFNEKAQMQTGWINDNGIWYYAFSNGKRATGLQVINGKTYFFDQYQSDWMVSNCEIIVGTDYYRFGSNGAAITGWYPVEDYLGNRYWYYYDADGKMHTGWLKSNNKWFYLLPSYDSITGRARGTMAFNVQLTINGKEYFFSESGVMFTGWRYDAYGVEKKYHLPSGELAKGWQKIDGKWYYFDQASHYYCAVMDSWKKIDGYWYRFDKNGVMLTGWYKAGQMGPWYYLGTNGKRVSGWLKIDGYWYYFIPSESDRAAMHYTVVEGRPSNFTADGKWIGYAN